MKLIMAGGGGDAGILEWRVGCYEGGKGDLPGEERGTATQREEGK